MEYKIWIATYLNSPPPYPIEVPAEEIERHACIWKTEETVWRHIGTVDSLEAAKYMVKTIRAHTKIKTVFATTLNASLTTNSITASSKLSMATQSSTTTVMFRERNIGMGEDLSNIIRTLFQNNPE